MRLTESDSRVQQWLDLAEDALERGEAQVTVELCSKVLESQPGHAGAAYLKAEALRDLGDPVRATRQYEAVVRSTPQHSLAWAGLAWSLFELVRLDEANVAVARAIRLSPRLPEALYLRAILRERRDDHLGAHRDYLRASRLDPAQFPMPLELSDAVVDAIVEDALRSLHPSIRAYLSQVSILLEEFPDEDLCMQYEPPAPPSEFLGYFTGVSMRDRSFSDPWSNLPSAIVLFRRNLARVAMDRERLLEELRITVFHEVGHFLGLSEADLEARGLE